MGNRKNSPVMAMLHDNYMRLNEVLGLIRLQLLYLDYDVKSHRIARSSAMIRRSQLEKVQEFLQREKEMLETYFEHTRGVFVDELT
jgi:hypothetical protein